MSASERDSLTGVWDGLLSYPRLMKPMAFTAVVFEIGGSINGTTHEVAVDGRFAGVPMTATITGRRQGSSVDFVKTYDPAGGQHARPIHYQGTLNSDATEIDGRWRIPGQWSGKFLLIRAGRAAVSAEATKREPVSVE